MVSPCLAASPLEIVSPGCPTIEGALPSGHEVKKGVTIETTLAADCGVSNGCGAGVYELSRRTKAL